VNLHGDARSVLAAWAAPDEAQEALRVGFLDLLDTEPDATFRHCHPDHLTASALIVRDASILLVRHAKAGKWLQTGGHCEPTDASLAAAALREAREESGIHGLLVDPVPLQLSRHYVPFCGPQPAGGHHLDVQFLVRAGGTSRLRGTADATIQTADDEDEVGWFPLDAAAIPEPTDQDVRTLIAAATTRLRGTP
jgi:ADP-ribose pyrophosphatase YjhB (NUDIX family)